MAISKTEKNDYGKQYFIDYLVLSRTVVSRIGVGGIEGGGAKIEGGVTGIEGGREGGGTS